MTEADVAAFVGLSGDYNPLYTDLEHAKSSLFGGPVAPGALVAAVTSGLGAMDVPLPATVGLVGMSWKFLLPVQPGDTLGSRWRLSRKRNVENPRWGLAVWDVEVENQRAELVASGEVTRLVAKRDQAVERTSRSRRRRRKSAPAGQTAADVVLSEPVPEPAPADLPPPPARRRRRRGAGEGSQEPAPAAAPTPGPAPEPEPTQAPLEAPGDSGPPKRRRRRRSSNGSGNNRDGGRQPEMTPAPEPVGTAPAGPAPSSPAPVGAAPVSSPFGADPAMRPPEPRASFSQRPADAGGGLGRVFRRLRRT